ncbi:MAG: DUF5009 domain-containing protein [Candidatus Latescibacteria bacterium]|nr:DUF5009 domain-containing protein [Candidatus Latescibacterota bacterium]
MQTNTPQIPKGRIVSIDALRGFDMFWIIGGGTVFLRLFELIDTPLTRVFAAQLEHSSWHGFTFEDLIFPLFLFIMGASMPYAITKRLERGDSHRDLYIHIIKRAFIIYFLSLCYYGLLDFHSFGEQRYLGVLARIAIAYFFTGLIVMNTGVRGQVIWAAAILIVHWAAVMLIPVPGHGAGVLTPDGNLGVYLDQTFLPGRLWTYGDYKLGDATGIIGTFTAVSSTLIGVLSGHWLRSESSDNTKIKWLGIAGAASLVSGIVWNIFFPINKFLWNGPYVMFAAGWCLLLLVMFYWIIDMRGYKKWAFPFVVIGLNPITIYVADRFIKFEDFANIFVHGFIDNMGAFQPLFWAICVLAVKWLFLYFLYRQKIFLKA